MNLADFTTRFSNAFQTMVFPKCNKIEKKLFEAMITTAAYKLGQMNGNDTLQKMMIVDKDGNVDLDLVEYVVGNVVEWPLKVDWPFQDVFPLNVGTFKFSKDDWTELMKSVREQAK